MACRTHWFTFWTDRRPLDLRGERRRPRGSGLGRPRSRARSRRRPARGGGGRRRRLRLARGGAGLGAGSRPGGNARRDRGGRACAVRADPGRAARDRDRGRVRSGARPAPGLRGRSARGARLERLPRPGPVHPVADGRLGRLRGGRRPASSAAATALGVRGALSRARVRLRDPARPLAVVRVHAAHLGCAHRDPRRRRGVQHRARAREPRPGARPGPELRRVLERHERRSRTEVVWT